MALQHAKSGEIVDLAPLGPGLKQAPSTAIVKTAQFEAIRLVLPANTEIPAHQVPGNITLHCLEGEVELDIAPTRIRLKADQWTYLDGGASHGVRAIVDTALLLTIFLDGRGASNSNL